MHNNILSEGQIRLLPLIKRFSGEFGLVGGTAIALHLGHRESIDFDLFTFEAFNSSQIRNIVRKDNKIDNILVNNSDELTISVDGVKTTFYKYPFLVDFSESLDSIIKLPGLLTLAAMKVYALGQTAKWKDYVDLYFIFKKYSLKEVVEKAQEIFKTEFNEKLLREQLSYFKDLDYSEDIHYKEGFETKDEEIESFLTQVSLQQDSTL